MKNFRARYMKQIKYEMTKKDVKNLPQDEENDNFISADEYREIVMGNEDGSKEKLVRVSFTDGSAFPMNKSTFLKMKDKVSTSKVE
eukprot:CAMPEP_0170568050 /NCGR_PEP_ID=MMETSP0211-20121228/80885_1 /TAXON_ID=311385 /ORGANISM="Pseudokeronopsis sp., Strain OXSARD2" /LENGTH=85 /DNA_ID=CAMNT_0010889709 /DNA_START=1 /DNA_END=258 /DNA_ORIENTATION=-